ncbi:hypothetical protein RDWZM_010225 [Blomia tropicalis]|uniref:Uncharacterized protein n=1 Tax=Blomia tropicalis TaxID=40697 RepID=A0A9Q0RIU8_BLOTA|nr:hypothetical protein RDWZM_010225 [Blomia tropicalis]
MALKNNNGIGSNDGSNDNDDDYYEEGRLLIAFDDDDSSNNNLLVDEDAVSGADNDNDVEATPVNYSVGTQPPFAVINDEHNRFEYVLDFADYAPDNLSANVTDPTSGAVATVQATTSGLVQLDPIVSNIDGNGAVITIKQDEQSSGTAAYGSKTCSKRAKRKMELNEGDDDEVEEDEDDDDVTEFDDEEEEEDGGEEEEANDEEEDANDEEEDAADDDGKRHRKKMKKDDEPVA